MFPLEVWLFDQRGIDYATDDPGWGAVPAWCATGRGYALLFEEMHSAP